MFDNVILFSILILSRLDSAVKGIKQAFGAVPQQAEMNARGQADIRGETHRRQSLASGLHNR